MYILKNHCNEYFSRSRGCFTASWENSKDLAYVFDNRKEAIQAWDYFFNCNSKVKLICIS